MTRETIEGRIHGFGEGVFPLPTSPNCEGSSERARRPAPDESLLGCGNRGDLALE